MVYGGENPEREQRTSERNQVGRNSRRQQRKAATGIEQRHHVATAPAIAEPAGRQREYPEGNEGGGAKCDQLGVAAPVDHFEADHHGRKNQHDVMIERMRPIDEGDGAPGLALIGREHLRHGWLRIRIGLSAVSIA